MIIHVAVAALVIIMGVDMYDAHAQSNAPPPSAFSGFGSSPFERDFGDVKFLDAYFGTEEQKIEVEPGDSNVPLTVVFANVGSQDITAIRGQLSLPFGFSSPEGVGGVIYADSNTGAPAGERFTLTFFVNIEQGAEIRQYPAAVKVDYSRLRESGLRTTFEKFEFKVTGDTVINVRAQDPFLTSLRVNDVAIQITNDGTAPLAGVEVSTANTQTERATTAASITNIENVVLSESSWDLGRVGPGSHGVITTTVYVPETLRGETLRIPLEISYYNAHGERIVVSKIVDMFVKGLIDLTIFNIDVIEISGSTMIIGEIINEGNEDGLFGFVHVTPLGDSNILAASQFIDEIEVDAPVPFNIPVEFDGAPVYGYHDILVEARYKDGTRTEHVLGEGARVLIPEPPPPVRGPFDIGPAATGDGMLPEGGQQQGMIGGASNIVVAIIIAVVVGIAIAVWRIAAKRRHKHDDDDNENENDDFESTLFEDDRV